MQSVFQLILQEFSGVEGRAVCAQGHYHAGTCLSPVVAVKGRVALGVVVSTIVSYTVREIIICSSAEFVNELTYKESLMFMVVSF